MSANNHKKEAKNEQVKPEKSVADPEIQEIQNLSFHLKRRVPSEKRRSRRVSMRSRAGVLKKYAAAVALFVAAAVAFILVGIMVCEIDVTVVCAILVIQVAVSVLLDHNPVWLHICVAAADLIVGFCLNQILLMTASMVLYVVAVVALEILQRAGMQRKM